MSFGLMGLDGYVPNVGPSWQFFEPTTSFERRYSGGRRLWEIVGARGRPLLRFWWELSWGCPATKHSAPSANGAVRCKFFRCEVHARG